MITERRSNIQSLFPRGGVLEYSTPVEAVDAIRAALAEPDFAKRQGKLAQEQTLSQHTYAHRAPELLELLSTR
jgi:spore maturation protein CgeB